MVLPESKSAEPVTDANDFRPLREEIAFYERVHSSSINGIEQWKQISDKATYYRKMFE